MTRVSDCKNWKRLMPGQPDTCFNCIKRDGQLIVGYPSQDCKNFRTKTITDAVVEQRTNELYASAHFGETLRQRNELLKTLEQLYDMLPDIDDTDQPLGKMCCVARGLIDFCKDYDTRNAPA